MEDCDDGIVPWQWNLDDFNRHLAELRESHGQRNARGISRSVIVLEEFNQGP